MSDKRITSSRIPGILALITGILFFICGILYNRYLLGLISSDVAKNPELQKGIVNTQIIFLILALIFVLFSLFILKVKFINKIAQKSRFTNSLLVFLVLFIPLCTLELSFRPFSNVSGSSIFIRDDILGWKLRPNTEAVWTGVNVRINSKGLRGPEIEYEKPEGVQRILYLGDSVTFGAWLASYKQTFSYIIDSILNLNYNVQMINAGVAGYSTRQEYLFLKNEGFKYDPDLVVISFLLNDVSEKLGSSEFGMSDWNNTNQSFWEKLYKNSGLVYLARQISARLRFGGDIQKGASEKEVRNVKTMIENPSNPEVVQAWDNTLTDLENIFYFCRENNTEVLLVIFPFTFQFENPEKYMTPQSKLIDFAEKYSVPVIDLLTELSEYIKSNEKPPEDYFITADHPSVEGSKAIADIIAKFILEKQLLMLDNSTADSLNNEVE